MHVSGPIGRGHDFDIGEGSARALTRIVRIAVICVIVNAHIGNLDLVADPRQLVLFGHLALDLVNTVSWRLGTARREFETAYATASPGGDLEFVRSLVDYMLDRNA